jgi:ATP-dependent helicase/nuclease subunit A
MSGASILEEFDLTPVQKRALDARGRDVVLTAGAGSGKTRTLTARYLSLLEEGFAPRSIAAVTFTEKAAREMRNRIRSKVSARVQARGPSEGPARWAEIEADIDTARIGTIHSLCAEIIRAHPVEAAVDPGFEVLDEGLAAAWRAQAVEDALAWVSGEEELVPLLRALSPAQLRAGLARLIAFRLDSLESFAGQELIARWDAALAARLREFVSDPDVAASIGKLELLHGRGKLEADAGPKLREQVEHLLEEWHLLSDALARSSVQEAVAHVVTIREGCLNLQRGKRDGQAKSLVRIVRERYEQQVERWLARPASVEALAAAENRLRGLMPSLGALFAKGAEFYALTREQNHALDFDDLEDKAAWLLERPEVRKRWRTEIRAVLVDEFQDTNARQRRIIEALAGTRDGARGALFIVGDAKQSIYRFRGADVTVFVDVEQSAERVGGLVLRLDDTFRAHPGLVEVFNELLGHVMGGRAPARRFHIAYEPLHAKRSAPRPDSLPPFVELLFAAGKDAGESRRIAAAGLAARLSELRDGGAMWDDMALLFRASTSFPEFERALEEVGIPFVTVAGGGFYDRPEIRDLLNVLRAIANPWDDLAMAGLLRSPAFGLSDAALHRLRLPQPGAAPLSYRQALKDDLGGLPPEERARAARARAAVDQLSRMANRVSVGELLKEVLDSTLYGAALRAAPGGERLARNVEKLLQDAHASAIVRVEDFLDYVETLKSAGAREGEAPSEAQGAVRLMTVHKAKGLEFPIVVLADASRQAPLDFSRVVLSRGMGVVARPGRRSDEEPLSFRLAKAMEREEEQAEELRLLYVGATRAQERLIVIGQRGATRGGSWFSMLADALPAEGSSPSPAAGYQRVVRLPESGGLVALREAADVPPTARRAAPPAAPVEAAAAEPLYRVVPVQEIETSDDKPLLSDEARGRRTDIFAARPENEATLVGNLVHLAIRRWCFPGDARLRPLLMAAVRETGLLDADEAERHVAQAQELLGRLRTDRRWPELDRARRFHEVPYSFPRNGGTTSGYIDLLVETEGHTWQVIDFKTTAIEAQAELDRLMQTEFAIQLARYREAVAKSLGESVETWVCLLDYQRRLEWRRGP